MGDSVHIFRSFAWRDSSIRIRALGVSRGVPWQALWRVCRRIAACNDGDRNDGVCIDPGAGRRGVSDTDPAAGPQRAVARDDSRDHRRAAKLGERSRSPRGGSGGAGGKAFCAGGDIRWFYQAHQANDPLLDQFFVEEYALNHLIHRYAKPYIALMDGVVMGGGMGISQGARLRIVTERTKMAMPETNIGLFPDVGGGWFLARTQGHIGEYLGLTGAVIGAADAIYAKLADAYLPTNAIAEMVAALQARQFTSGEAVLEQIASFTRQHSDACVPSTSQLASSAALIDSLFAGASAQAILAAVSDADGDWAAQTAATLRSRSPLMLCVTLEQIRRARTMSLEDELRMELDMMHDVFRHGDGIEGIRALVIDKDHQPKWNPPRLDEVSAARVRAFFDSPWRRMTILGHAGRVSRVECRLDWPAALSRARLHFVRTRSSSERNRYEQSSRCCRIGGKPAQGLLQPETGQGPRGARAAAAEARDCRDPAAVAVQPGRRCQSAGGMGGVPRPRPSC
jgi:enoyl-CoA hydratase